MDPQEMLATAPDRIREHRTAEIYLHLVDESGQPQPNVQARVRLVRHEFGFGCNAFLLGGDTDGGSAEDALQRAYKERFATLLNYATLPFY